MTFIEFVFREYQKNRFGKKELLDITELNLESNLQSDLAKPFKNCYQKINFVPSQMYSLLYLSYDVRIFIQSPVHGIQRSV